MAGKADVEGNGRGRREPILFGRFAEVLLVTAARHTAAQSVLFFLVFNCLLFVLAGRLFPWVAGAFMAVYAVAAVGVFALAAHRRLRGGFPGDEAAVLKTVRSLHGVRCFLVFNVFGALAMFHLSFHWTLDPGGWPALIVILAGVSGAVCGALDAGIKAFWEHGTLRGVIARVLSREAWGGHLSGKTGDVER